MIVLVYGHKGWIGEQFTKCLDDENIAWIPGHARVDNYEDVEKELQCQFITHCVCLIGRTHGPGNNTIDYLEDKLNENIRDNLYAPVQLGFMCTQQKIHYTYVGTGCIYETTEDHLQPFDEKEEPNFHGSSYSIIKGYTDKIMRGVLKDSVLNLRIRLPISKGHHPRNLITKLIQYEQIMSIPNSVTVLPTLLPIMVDMIKKSTIGTFNFVNPGAITHNDILELYKKNIDTFFEWKNFEDKELRQKRSNNILDTSKLECMYDNIPSAFNGIKTVLENFKT